MRRLFGTDETYYAFIFILVLIVNGIILSAGAKAGNFQRTVVIQVPSRSQLCRGKEPQRIKVEYHQVAISNTRFSGPGFEASVSGALF
jgi:hypothetical protein